MRSTTPILGLLRTVALIGLVVVLAACSRNGTGVAARNQRSGCEASVVAASNSFVGSAADEVCPEPVR